MPSSASARADEISFAWRSNRSGAVPVDRHWANLAQTSILVLGSPRSGTSWLAKIFDSHPNILYRHEPDERVLATPGLEPDAQITEWLMQRSLHVAAKRPMFRKSWLSAPLDRTRRGLAALIAALQRIPALSNRADRFSVPDLIAPNRWGGIRAAIKLVNWDGSLAAQAMPDARVVFILRHPCGQIASVMAGLANKKFDRGSDESSAPLDLTAALALAEQAGIDRPGFDALPDAAKYAWAWRAFNEPATAALRHLQNARIVIYEELCRQPEAVSRDLFRFAGLEWHPQTTVFLGTSTQHDRPAGYFDVYRLTGVVADRWRQTMSPGDQDAVRKVVSTSPLARCWPDLAPPAA